MMVLRFYISMIALCRCSVSANVLFCVMAIIAMPSAVSQSALIVSCFCADADWKS